MSKYDKILFLINKTGDTSLKSSIDSIKKYYSNTLQMMFYWDKNLKKITFEDGIEYSEKEIMELQSSDKNAIETIHLMKQLFKGEVNSKYEERMN